VSALLRSPAFGHIAFPEDGQVTFPHGTTPTGSFAGAACPFEDGVAESAMRRPVAGSVPAAIPRGVPEALICSTAKVARFPGPRDTPRAACLLHMADRSRVPVAEAAICSTIVSGHPTCAR
jgi:hypothetical protein